MSPSWCTFRPISLLTSRTLKSISLRNNNILFQSFLVRGERSPRKPLSPIMWRYVALYFTHIRNCLKRLAIVIHIDDQNIKCMDPKTPKVRIWTKIFNIGKVSNGFQKCTRIISRFHIGSLLTRSTSKWKDVALIIIFVQRDTQLGSLGHLRINFMSIPSRTNNPYMGCYISSGHSHPLTFRNHVR